MTKLTIKKQNDSTKFKILLATRNPGKTTELKQGLASLIQNGYEVKSLVDLGIKEDIEETGVTFKENARLKAIHYANLTGWPAIGDDGGFVIKILNGEPGVKSRRWLGYEASDEELIEYTLKRMSNVPIKDRQAYLEVCLCYFDPKTKQTLYEIEKIRGYVAEKPSQKRILGFPFRALHIVEPFNKYYDELTDKEHMQVNHRFRALQRLIGRITNNQFIKNTD